MRVDIDSHAARLAACCAAICAGLPTTAAAQEQRPAYRANVEMVRLNIAVIDPSGGTVPTLVEEDFRVYDNGVEQEIALFLTPSDSPLDVGLVLDSSTSMTPVALTVRRAALTFLGLLEADDCAYVLPFTDQVGPGRWGRAGEPSIRSFVDRIVVGGGTSLYDAMLHGLAALERVERAELVGSPGGAADLEGAPVAEAGAAGKRAGELVDSRRPTKGPLSSQIDDAVLDLAVETDPSRLEGCGAPLPPIDPTNSASARRRALVVLSDGADENSEAGFDAVLAAARIASVPVFPVALGYANEDRHLKARLARLARATGGRLIESLGPQQLRNSYSDVVKLLRSSYLIGYYPIDDPGERRGEPIEARQRAEEGEALRGLTWHEVRVELRRPKFRALVRPGYYR